MSKIEKLDLLELTTQIVSSHLSNNNLSTKEIPALIKTVYDSLETLNHEELAAPKLLKPAVPVNQSIGSDYIVCLEDGKKLKMLKRHLKTAYGMTPEEYRDKWSLPHDYPMVAPDYAKTRSKLAKEIGLGTVGREG